jgi:putative ABC transport system substrate-binding protein
MRRREFIALIGGATAWPAHAQVRAGVPTIGFLSSDAAAWSPWTAAFVDRLRQLGWIDGRTVAIEYRWSQGRAERAAEIAAEFVRLKVDVIVAAGPAVTAAKQATTVIPIVFALANDPIRSGLVASLANPGGNITGLSVQSPDLVGKRLTFLREAVPNLRRLAVMLNAAFSEAVIEMDEVQAGARSLGIEVTPLEIRRAEDIGPAFEAVEAKADALYIAPDALVTANRTRIITFALAGRLPIITSGHDWVTAGGLMSYGPNYLAQFRRTADLVDKVLRGTKPGEIPVEEPTKFELTVNLTTARALKLAIPESFLALADEVIE